MVNQCNLCLKESVPRFPKKEADIVALAQTMASSLTDNAAAYPALLVAPADLATLSIYTVAKNTVDFDDDKLRVISWAGQKGKDPVSDAQLSKIAPSTKIGCRMGILGLEGTHRKPNAPKAQRKSKPLHPWAILTCLPC